MQKTSKLSLAANTFTAIVLCLLNGMASAQSAPAIEEPTTSRSATRDSYLTVDQLVRAENAAARSRALKEIDATGIGAPKQPGKETQAVKRSPDSPASVSIQKIAGIGNNYKVDLTYNGTPLKDLTVGSTVRNCELARVAGQCVVLREKRTKETAKQASPAASKASVVPDQCPTACWTGVQVTTNFASNTPNAPLPPGGPAAASPTFPVPIPFAPGPLPKFNGVPNPGIPKP